MKIFLILLLISAFFLTSFCKNEQAKPSNKQNISNNLTDTLQINLKEIEKKSCFTIPFVLNDSLFEMLKLDSSLILNNQLRNYILPLTNFLHTSTYYKYDNLKNTFYYGLDLWNNDIYFYKDNSLKMVFSDNYHSDTLIAFINIEILRPKTKEERYRIAWEPCPYKIDLNKAQFDLRKFNYFYFIDIYNNKRFLYKINH
jgi:hypothetical protein